MGHELRLAMVHLYLGIKIKHAAVTTKFFRLQIPLLFPAET
jgi:hypothetical protein